MQTKSILAGFRFFLCTLLMASLCLAAPSWASDPNASPTPEEQARTLQEQSLQQLLGRLDAAATLMGRGQTRDAIDSYLHAFQGEPNFVDLAARSSELSTQTDAIQQKIFQVQRQDPTLSTPVADDLATQKIALEGQLQTVQKLLALKPSFAEAHANLAHLLLQIGASSESLLQYQQAIRLRPALETTLRPAILHAHLVEADHLAKLGRPEALAQYREAIKLSPGNASARFGLGNALLAQGKAVEAVPELTEAVRLDPSDTEAALTLGLALYQSDRREEARQQWRQLAESRDAQAAAEAHGMLDQYLLAPILPITPPKDPKEAELLRCRDQVQNYPHEAFAHNNLALALFNAKQMDEALVEVNKALDLNPDSVEAHTNLGLILSDSKRSDAAVEQYRQALRLDSDNGAVHNDLGVVYFNREQWKQAEYEFRKALEGDHSDPYAHHNLADTLLREGRLKESIRECGKTLQYDPGFFAAYGTRGLVEDKAGEPDAGLTDLRLAVHSSADPAQALLDLAEPLREFAGRGLAARQFRAILKEYPETADGEETLGRLLLISGQDQEAAAAFQSAIHLKPDQVSAHLLLARTLLRLNHLAEAASEARAALGFEPRSAEARNTLGLALYQSGQTQEARRQWQSALALDDKDAAKNAASFLSEFP